MEGKSEFRDLLAYVSTEYEGENRLWVRLLLHDHCDGMVLSKEDVPVLEWFNELKSKGCIHYYPTDVEILLDIAKVTENKKAIELINKFKLKHPNNNEEYSFTDGKPITEYRKRLFKALRQNTTELPKILEHYSISNFNFTTIWDIVYHLERYELLVNENNSMGKFAMILDEEAREVFWGKPAEKVKRSASSNADDMSEVKRSRMSNAIEPEPTCDVDRKPSSSGLQTLPGLSSQEDQPDMSREDMCFPRGRGYVLYISNFFEKPDHTNEPRAGVHHDKNNICDFFGGLDYKLNFRSDVETREELWKIIKKAKKRVEEKNYTSFFLIISSHGKGITLKDESGDDVLDDVMQKPVFVSEDIQLVNENTFVRVDEIVSQFENFLLDKPKVLIFQACRSSPSKPDDSSNKVYYTGQEHSSSVTVPTNVDMVVIQDTSKGHSGYRNDAIGAWMFHYMFVKAKPFYEKEHLLDVLTRVNDMISRRNAQDGKKIIGKQMPCFTSTLTKFFHLK